MKYLPKEYKVLRKYLALDPIKGWIWIKPPTRENFRKDIEKMTDKVRAKVQFTSTRTYHNGWATVLEFETRYDNNIPEDQRFQKATPYGKFEMNVDNPAAIAFFKPGKKYYVDFIEVEDDGGR